MSPYSIAVAAEADEDVAQFKPTTANNIMSTTTSLRRQELPDMAVSDTSGVSPGDSSPTTRRMGLRSGGGRAGRS